MIPLDSPFPRFCVASLLLAAVAASPTVAGSFYISPSGRDTRGCTNDTNDACYSFARCAEVMQPGDTCFALDGTYLTQDTDPVNWPGNGWAIVAAGGTRARPFRFTSLSQDPTKVVIKPADSAHKDTYVLVGGNTGDGAGRDKRGEGIAFDHLTFEGRMQSYANLREVDYHHNICRCPNTGTGGGNQACFYTQRMPYDMHYDIRIYDNLFYRDDSCPAPGDNSNMAFIVMYHSNGTIVENNDFLDLSSNGNYSNLFFKSGNKDHRSAQLLSDHFQTSRMPREVIWLMDCDGEFRIDEWGDRSNQGGSARCNSVVHNNIVIGGGNGIVAQDNGHRFEHIYNNTVVGTTTGCITSALAPTYWMGGTDIDVFNNICYRPASGTAEHVRWPPYSDKPLGCMASQAYFDNNMYYPADLPSVTLFSDCFVDADGDSTADTGETRRFSSFTTWKQYLASTGKEQHSRGGIPFSSTSRSMTSGCRQVVPRGQAAVAGLADGTRRIRHRCRDHWLHRRSALPRSGRIGLWLDLPPPGFGGHPHRRPVTARNRLSIDPAVSDPGRRVLLVRRQPRRTPSLPCTASPVPSLNGHHT